MLAVAGWCLFTAVGSTITDVGFFLPGTSTAATTSAFGLVFTDVKVAGLTRIDFFDADGDLIFSRGVLWAWPCWVARGGAPGRRLHGPGLRGSRADPAPPPCEQALSPGKRKPGRIEQHRLADQRRKLVGVQRVGRRQHGQRRLREGAVVDQTHE
jgi:hypothetical protein